MPAQQITYTLQLAAAETLRGYDFEPGLWDEARTPRLELRIETLDHQVTAGVPYELATEVALTATGYANGQRYTTRSGTTLTRQRPLPPTADANADAINTALSRALAGTGTEASLSPLTRITSGFYISQAMELSR